MQSNKVTPAHIQKITGPEVRHYFPADMSVGSYPPDYHKWLIANWQEVMNDVRANCPDYVPF